MLLMELDNEMTRELRGKVNANDLTAVGLHTNLQSSMGISMMLQGVLFSRAQA